MKFTIEHYIEENLQSTEKQNALALVEYLREIGVEFIKGDGYWQDKIYYLVKTNDKYMCFIAIKDPDDTDNLWTVWSDDIDENLLNQNSISKELQQIAWDNVDRCSNCGSCNGGRKKIIFGKEFDDVCGCAFRFDNPNKETLEFIKTILEIIKMKI